MNLSEQLNIKSIYRITGTPENFLTALKFKIWGFNEGNKSNWQNLIPGDIIYFHSKGTGSLFLGNNALRPVVIGFGVVGNNFFYDEAKLWIDEKEHNLKYPYRFLFSEIYLFSDIPISQEWDSTTFKTRDVTSRLIIKLIENGIPLSELNSGSDQFPHMASYSSVRSLEIRKQLLEATKPLFFYQGDEEKEESFSKTTDLIEISNKKEALRFSTTLTVFEDVRRRIINPSSSSVKVNVEALNKAEKAHSDILSHLLDFLKDKGYTVLKNNHVDLFAYKKKEQSLLIEAKSNENNNFRTQSRKGIVQLFEYNYFEIEKFKSGKMLSFTNEDKLLITSQEPDDNKYVEFINSMGIKTAAVNKNKIVSYGSNQLNFTNL